MELKNFEAIIFDLGGVIIDIDPTLTHHAFSKIGKNDVSQLFTKTTVKGVFHDYEVGAFNKEEFLKILASEIGNAEVEHNDIEKAWNALLGDIHPARIELVKKLKNTHKTFVLSNTNEIHIEWINEYLAKNFGVENLDPWFDKVYFSHDLKMRKPGVEIYEEVLKREGLNANKTLFIDDNLDNLEGAKRAGLQVLHADREILDLIKL